MANTNVFTGAHGTLTLAALDNPEGKDAGSIIAHYQTQTVGRVTDVRLSVQTQLQEFHEVGRRYPTSLHPGNIHISGQVGRAYINGALIGLLLGKKSFLPDTAEPFVQPAFNMVLRIKDPAVVAADGPIVAQLNVNGVKFENWGYHLPEDDFLLEEVTFKALSLEITDIEGAVTTGPAFIV